MNQQFDIFSKQIDGYAKLALNGHLTLTKFLNESELAFLESKIKAPLKLTVFGGYDEAEMKRAIISHEDDTVRLDDFEILMYEITYHQKFLELTHKNVFGTMMNLGIERNTFGDIIIGKKSFIFVSKEMSEYLIKNLIIIQKVSVHLELTDATENQELLKKDYEMKKIIVSSLRLDAIVARAASLSRENAQIMIMSQLVKLNHKINENPSQIVKINDIISIRKFGRVKVFEHVGSTKKDKFVLFIGILH